MPTMSPHIAIAWVSAKVTAAIRRATRNTTFAEHGIVYKVIDENEIIDSARQGAVKTAIAHVLALSCNSSHCGSSKWRHMISCYLLIARKRQWCLSSRLEAKCHWGERLAWLYDFCLKRSIQKWGERSQRKHWMNENKGVNWGSEFRCSYGGCKIEGGLRVKLSIWSICYGLQRGIRAQDQHSSIYWAARTLTIGFLFLLEILLEFSIWVARELRGTWINHLEEVFARESAFVFDYSSWTTSARLADFLFLLTGAVFSIWFPFCRKCFVSWLAA
jgi:hypothetical protein